MSFNKIVKRIVFIVLGIIGALWVGYYIFPYVFFYLPRPISSESWENIRIEKENRDECLKFAKIWMQETYGDAIYKTIDIEDIDTFHINDIWMPTRYLPNTVIKFSTPFYKNAKIFVDSKNHNVITCNMRLLEDYSFRKIYNKWIKQQLGINDDHMALYYYNEDYIIDYTEIESLENLNEDICTRIRNVKIKDIEISKYEYNTINELMDYVIFIINKILEKKPKIIGSGCRLIFNTMNEDKYFINYKKGDNKLRWYKHNYITQDKTTQDEMNIYIIPSSK